MKKITFFFVCLIIVTSINAKSIKLNIYNQNSSDIKIVNDTCKVEGQIKAEKENADGSMSIIEAEESAPVRVHFEGEGEVDVYYYKWGIYKVTGDSENLIADFRDPDFTYTFYESGDYIIKLEVANSSSECAVEDFKSLKILESELEAPNFFSPQSSPGINDEFKVHHRSLVKFKCTIFNRWGVKLYEWNDPNKGWDGKYKGKYVKPGVYFYVIQATGSEGHKYKKMGDINIL